MKNLNKLFLLACLSGLMVACGSSSSGGGGSASCEHGTRDLLDGEQIAEIPASVAKVYNFTFHGPVVKSFEAAADSQDIYEEGDKVKFEIKEDGTLIIADKIALCDPVLYDPTGGDVPNPAEAIWFDDENGLAYSASSIIEDEEVWEINLANGVHYDHDDFVFLGQFSNKSDAE